MLTYLRRQLPPSAHPSASPPRHSVGNYMLLARAFVCACAHPDTTRSRRRNPALFLSFVAVTGAVGYGFWRIVNDPEYAASHKAAPSEQELALKCVPPCQRPEFLPSASRSATSCAARLC
jgi:hypothetical protein